jgi:hypothetical protein
MNDGRYYRVVNTQSPTCVPRLIKAANPAQAIAFAKRGVIVASTVTQDELIAMLASGVKPERARPEEPELPLTETDPATA